jgi:hypothetical protein
VKQVSSGSIKLELFLNISSKKKNDDGAILEEKKKYLFHQ